MDPQPTPPSDELLLSRFARGDAAALGELASRHESNLLGLAGGLLDGRADLAQDAVQDAWVRVIKYGKSFAGQSSFRTWIYRIVINRCRDLRSVDPHRRTPTPEPTPTESAAPANESPLRLVVAEAENEDLRAALRELAPATRLLLLLCYHRGLNHPQAAEVLGIPVGTLKSRLSAALAELRGTLGAGESVAAARTKETRAGT